MKRTLRLAATLATSAPAMLATAASPPADVSAPAPYVAEAQVREIHGQLHSALARADAGALDRLVAQDFFAIEGNGEWLERGPWLAALVPAAPLAEVAQGGPSVRLFGDVALVEGVLERRAATSPIRIRYTEGYHWQAGRWQLVHVQHTTLREGVAVAQRGGEVPSHPSWQGADPQGEDRAVLVALNDQYVRAFREADVAWYDEHLATGYGVVNSDGSFDDRARALEEFALPVFAQHLAAFPVGQVRVRALGDVAFIHAENDYLRKDGKRGINRYTDVWHRQPEGGWRCVSAHITTFRAPQ